MKLSVIIVNYNVKYFLEQCLKSVHKAIKNNLVCVFVDTGFMRSGERKQIQELFNKNFQIKLKIYRTNTNKHY